MEGRGQIKRRKFLKEFKENLGRIGMKLRKLNFGKPIPIPGKNSSNPSG